MKYFGTTKINEKNHLEIGGVDLVELGNEKGTPIYIMDYDYLNKNIDEYKNNFISKDFDTEVLYASKALSCIGIYQILNKAGLSVDVVSGGELYTAYKAGFPMNRVYFHGNNKTVDELTQALSLKVGCIVLDNEIEYKLLSELCTKSNKKQKVLLRVNPGIEAHTHEYIQTSKNNSKFGVSIFEKQTDNLIKEINEDQNLEFRGLHCHIGSQIFDNKSFEKAALEMLNYIVDLKNRLGISVKDLNLGGGFGIYYSEGDTSQSIETTMKDLIKAVENILTEKEIRLEKLIIEPGRSIVGNAGTTLYKIGGIKNTFGGIKYIFVDGGMTDNPRPALYQAQYEAVIANKVNGDKKEMVSVAGKCCESGDVLIKNIELEEASSGDFLAVFATGAYNYSMASNYNRIQKPAVVLVKDGNIIDLIERETFEDIVSKDKYLW